MIIQAKDAEELERLRIQYLGKSGLLTQLAQRHSPSRRNRAGRSGPSVQRRQANPKGNL